MKAATCALVLFAFLGVALSAQRCTQQSDCEEDECCLDTLFFKSAFCEKRYAAGQRCPTASIYKPETDLYYFTCPCVNMYECLGKGSLDEFGVTTMKDAKCIMPTK